MKHKGQYSKKGNNHECLIWKKNKTNFNRFYILFKDCKKLSTLHQESQNQTQPFLLWSLSIKNIKTRKLVGNHENISRTKESSFLLYMHVTLLRGRSNLLLTKNRPISKDRCTHRALMDIWEEKSTFYCLWLKIDWEKMLRG